RTTQCRKNTRTVDRAGDPGCDRSLSLFPPPARSRPDHPDERRDPTLRFLAVAKCLQRIPFHRCVLAGISSDRFPACDPRLPAAPSAPRTVARPSGLLNSIEHVTPAIKRLPAREVCVQHGMGASAHRGGWGSQRESLIDEGSANNFSVFF